MELVQHFAEFKFVESNVFGWRPQDRTITFDPKRITNDKGKMQLLHELGHALLNHKTLPEDTRYQLERDAWEVARLLANKLDLKPQELLIARQLQDVRKSGY